MSKEVTIKSDFKVTDKHKEIVQLLANDHSPLEIAEFCRLSVRTVEANLMALRKVIGCRSSIGVVVFFFRKNLIK